jgi:hypothetical protein
LTGDIDVVAGVETVWSEMNRRFRIWRILCEHGYGAQEHADTRP